MTSPLPKIDGEALLAVFHRYLRDHNLPVTHQREAIDWTVFFSEGHLSVEDVERALMARDGRIGRATIYPRAPHLHGVRT